MRASDTLGMGGGGFRRRPSGPTSLPPPSSSSSPSRALEVAASLRAARACKAAVAALAIAARSSANDGKKSPSLPFPPSGADRALAISCKGKVNHRDYILFEFIFRAYNRAQLKTRQMV